MSVTHETEDQPKKEGKKRGRPRNENYLPWVEAREFMHNEMVPSRGKFFDWWDANKPKTIPRYPYRVYKEWTTWNDFLGNENEFNSKIGIKWRPFDEAVRWAHMLTLKTQDGWMEFARTSELPADIPARPDLVYSQWRSWGHWLGNKPIQAAIVKQETQKVAVFYVVHEQNVPGNVFTYDVEYNGITSLKEKWQVEKFDVVRVFWYDQTKANDVKKLVEHFSTPYLMSEKQRITPNVWQIISTLEMWLETIRKA